MKAKLLILPLIIIPLSSCQKEIKRNSFYFDTYTETRLYEGSEEDLSEINKIFSKIDKLTDNFKERDLNNVYKINNSLENVQVEPELYEVLQASFCDCLDPLNYYNPLIGSLSKKWKNSLENMVILDQETINLELTKMASTSVSFLEENTVKKTGEAEIDLGAVAKGYALDKVKQYLDSKNYTKYLVDAGSSSILLGEKNGGKDFKIRISNLDNTFLLAKNCFISTSSYDKQAVEIDGVNYSHIINPVNGSAINENDAVIVISDKGYLGDILSTAFINESIDSIKELEQHFEVKTIVIKNKTMVYKNEGIEVTNK
jgi:thiamine biosynthesis lipoprotein